MLIAAITVLARATGFVRTAVFGRTVGATCVGTVYQTVNTVPNIVFDIVAGGLLSALVVPILAPALHRGDLREASRIASALLTRVLAVLVVGAIVVVVLAGPITRALLGEHACPGATGLGTRMLLVFAPQLLFYGVGVVLGGALQAAERFGWPAIAPLLSSLVVVAAYLIYGATAGIGTSIAGLSRSSELVLSVGTTLGVVVLALSQWPSTVRLGLRLRPAWRLPTDVAPTVRRAAVAGAATLAAQQLATVVMLRLANSGTAAGTVVVVTLAQAVYLLPWSVFAVPVATAVFPRISAAWQAEDRSRARSLSATAVKAVLALAAVGSAALMAAATGIADLLLDRGEPARAEFAPTIVWFTAGLIGWSLVALLARLLYATRAVGRAAAAQVVGWLVAIGADIVLAVLLPQHQRAPALAAGNAIGVTVAAALLVVAARRIGVLTRVRGAALDLARTLTAGAAGAVVGWLLRGAVTGDGAVAALARTVVCATAALLVSVGVLLLLDRSLVGLARRSVRRSETVA